MPKRARRADVIGSVIVTEGGIALSGRNSFSLPGRPNSWGLGKSGSVLAHLRDLELECPAKLQQAARFSSILFLLH